MPRKADGISTTGAAVGVGLAGVVVVPPWGGVRGVVTGGAANVVVEKKEVENARESTNPARIVPVGRALMLEGGGIRVYRRFLLSSEKEREK
jgi:F0F1-type ATP synthase membrane subunit c/vacuolar-type H+-ATPase subunit K